FALVAACAIFAVPGPAERELARRLDDAIDAAHRRRGAIGTTQADAPAAARHGLQRLDRGLIFIRRPPPDQLHWVDPEREQRFGRSGDQPLEPQRGFAGVDIAHDFFRLGVCAAAKASSLSSAALQCRRCREIQLSIGASASARTRTYRHCRSTRRSINPARSSTCKCREIAGVEMSKGAATTPTLSSPDDNSRSTMARRVGSANAPKRSSSGGVRAAMAHPYLILLLINRSAL